MWSSAPSANISIIVHVSTCKIWRRNFIATAGFLPGGRGAWYLLIKLPLSCSGILVRNALYIQVGRITHFKNNFNLWF
jgi:hypothetical protein